MPARNSNARWGYISQWLHWIVVALVITQFVLASIAEDLPLGPTKLGVLARHKSVGITILALAALRLAWRALNATPALPATMSALQRLVARGTHALLYLLLFTVPLAGWVMSSARNFPVSWFGLVQLPDLVPKSQRLYEVMHDIHEGLAIALGTLAVLHALAALHHHYRRRDDVLRRMLPWGRA